MPEGFHFDHKLPKVVLEDGFTSQPNNPTAIDFNQTAGRTEVFEGVVHSALVPPHLAEIVKATIESIPGVRDFETQSRHPKDRTFSLIQLEYQVRGVDLKKPPHSGLNVYDLLYGPELQVETVPKESILSYRVVGFHRTHTGLGIADYRLLGPWTSLETDLNDYAELLKATRMDINTGASLGGALRGEIKPYVPYTNPRIISDFVTDEKFHKEYLERNTFSESIEELRLSETARALILSNLPNKEKNNSFERAWDSFAQSLNPKQFAGDAALIGNITSYGVSKTGSYELNRRLGDLARRKKISLSSHYDAQIQALDTAFTKVPRFNDVLFSGTLQTAEEAEKLLRSKRPFRIPGYISTSQDWKIAIAASNVRKMIWNWAMNSGQADHYPGYEPKDIVDKILEDEFEKKPVRVVTMYLLKEMPLPGISMPSIYHFDIVSADMSAEREILLPRGVTFETIYIERSQDRDGFDTIFRVLKPSQFKPGNTP